MKGVAEINTPGGVQNMTTVSESGVYRLVMRSNLPAAEAFQDWIAEDVVPAIRKTGSYQPAPAHPLPRTFSEALRELADAVEQRDAAETRIKELQPAADAWNTLAEAKGDYSVREAAQILCRDPLITTGQNRLFAYLRHIGWIDKNGIPYQAQVDLGRILPLARSYDHPRTGDRMTASQVRVTVKGLKELRVRLAGQQQLVVIEGGA
jgi:Prophage antirepressor